MVTAPKDDDVDGEAVSPLDAAEDVAVNHADAAEDVAVNHAAAARPQPAASTLGESQAHEDSLVPAHDEENINSKQTYIRIIYARIPT